MSLRWLLGAIVVLAIVAGLVVLFATSGGGSGGY
jgi:uncharacterized membrane protein YqiK